MTHADTLRAMASGHPGLSYASVVALIAGVEALDTVERVRHALNGIAREKADSEYARGHDDDPEWYGATADALEYVIDLLNEALEGEE